MDCETSRAKAHLDRAEQQHRLCVWVAVGILIQGAILLAGDEILGIRVRMIDLLTLLPFVALCLLCLGLAAHNHRKAGKILGFSR